MLDVFATESSGLVKAINTSSGINVMLKIREGLDIYELKKEADALGLPMSVLNEHVMLFSYNQIPLAQIPGLLNKLLTAWNACVSS